MISEVIFRFNPKNDTSFIFIIFENIKNLFLN
jgi:hypothetical protein